MEEVINTCSKQSAGIWLTIMRWLGYGDCVSPDFENDPYDAGYCESHLGCEVFVNLDILDALRLLFSRRMIVRISIKTDKPILRSYSKSNVGILPPWCVANPFSEGK